MMIRLQASPTTRSHVVHHSHAAAAMLSLLVGAAVIVGGMVTMAHLLEENFVLALGAMIGIFLLACAVWIPLLLPEEPA